MYIAHTSIHTHLHDMQGKGAYSCEKIMPMNIEFNSPKKLVTVLSHSFK